MAFLQEPEPQRGVLLPVLPGIGRIVAQNPGIMTYHGTNTYLVEGADGLSVIDPGPPSEQHVADILAAAGDTKIVRIVLTHSHFDHMGAAPRLREATGAPVHAFHQSGLAGYTPDIALHDDTAFAGLTAVHTPGHAADHLCFQFLLPDATKILFSGDHVMSWSSSIVSPPDGDMLAYYRSLRRVMARDDVYYLPGHGPKLPHPQELAAELLAHRQKREEAIIAAFHKQEWNVAALAFTLYDKADPALKFAATRNVLAHVLKLKAENIVTELEPDRALHPDIARLPARPPGPLPPGVTQQTIDDSRDDTRRRFALRAA
ncbi:MBL fold metallo-hydrolase [Acidocella sp.]|uniref:MBL fold metallo-hydrolase n=1 Tax=Acidocella sp. TaxID=50710 RepID=UPI00262DB163|nr:MBL fold metallo-hydrolase [Acidocella sp.]